MRLNYLNGVALSGGYGACLSTKGGSNPLGVLGDIMKTLLNVICQNFRVYTGVQFGLDTAISPLMAAKLLSCEFVAPNNEWTHKCSVVCDSTSLTTYHNNGELRNWLAYYEYEYDLAYLHGLGVFEDDYMVLRHLLKKRTKFIITGPSVRAKAVSTGYFKRRLMLDKEYTLYYLDVINEEIKKIKEGSESEMINHENSI